MFSRTTFLKDTLFLILIGCIFSEFWTRRAKSIVFSSLDWIVLLYVVVTLSAAAVTCVSLKAFEGVLYSIHLEYFAIVLYWATRLSVEDIKFRVTSRQLVFVFGGIACVWLLLEVLLTRMGWVSHAEFLVVTSASIANLGYRMGMGFYRPVGLVGSAHAAGYLCAAFAAAFYFDRHIERSLRQLGFFVACVATFFSLIRTAWVALFIVLVLGWSTDFLREPKNRTLRLAKSFITGAFLLVVLGYFKRLYLLNTFTGWFSEYLVQFQRNLGPFRQSPLFGAGLQMPREILNSSLLGDSFDYTRIDGDIFWVGILNGVGVVGAFALVVMMFVIPTMILISQESESKPFAAIVLVMGICSFHYSPFIMPPVAAVFWFSLGMLPGKRLTQKV